MAQVFKAVPCGMDAFAAANEGAAVTISAASSVDSGAMLTSAAATLGPIGASYLVSYAPALANNLAATRLVANVHAKIGDATLQSKVSINAAESAYAPIEPGSMDRAHGFWSPVTASSRRHPPREPAKGKPHD